MKIKIRRLHAPNETASNCIRHKLTKLSGEIDKFNIEVGNFNTPL